MEDDPRWQLIEFVENLGFDPFEKWTLDRGNRFIAGSNWVDAVGTFRDTVAIRADGTLWVSERPLDWRLGWRHLQEGAPSVLVQQGKETNWLSVTRDLGNSSVLLLKGDGTLWRWSGPPYVSGQKPRLWPGLRAFAPHRFGTDSDWVRVALASGAYGAGTDIAWKKDGSAWIIYGTDKSSHPPAVELEPGLAMEPLPALDNLTFRSLTEFWGCLAGVREDGRLWTWQYRQHSPATNGASYSLGPPTQLGKDTDWKMASGNNETLAALKADGSVWEWYVRRDEQRAGNGTFISVARIDLVPGVEAGLTPGLGRGSGVQLPGNVDARRRRQPLVLAEPE